MSGRSELLTALDRRARLSGRDLSLEETAAVLAEIMAGERHRDPDRRAS